MCSHSLILLHLCSVLIELLLLYTYAIHVRHRVPFVAMKRSRDPDILWNFLDRGAKSRLLRGALPTRRGVGRRGRGGLLETLALCFCNLLIFRGVPRACYYYIDNTDNRVVQQLIKYLSFQFTITTEL